MTLALPALAWTASPNYSSRGGQRVRLIVVHDCEGSFAGSVSWFAMAKSQVSAHIVLSEDGRAPCRWSRGATRPGTPATSIRSRKGSRPRASRPRASARRSGTALAAIVAVPPARQPHSLPGRDGGKRLDRLLPARRPRRRRRRPSRHHSGWRGVDAIRRARARVVRAARCRRIGRRRRRARAGAPAGWTPHGTIRHDLAPGSIEWVQAELNALGLPTPLTVDGVDGAATRAAIESFQATAGIGVDGDTGPHTVAALEEALAPPMRPAA